MLNFILAIVTVILVKIFLIVINKYELPIGSFSVAAESYALNQLS